MKNSAFFAKITIVLFILSILRGTFARDVGMPEGERGSGKRWRRNHATQTKDDEDGELTIEGNTLLIKYRFEKWNLRK